MRNSGVLPFKKYKMVPILFAFCSPECALPPIEVDALPESADTGSKSATDIIDTMHRLQPVTRCSLS
jgi:hypothetical protein